MLYSNLKYIFTPTNAKLLLAQLFVYIVYNSALYSHTDVDILKQMLAYFYMRCCSSNGRILSSSLSYRSRSGYCQRTYIDGSMRNSCKTVKNFL
jgi:hypothetical protein